MCAAVREKTKIFVRIKQKYRSQRPNLNKLEIKSPGDSATQI